MGEYTNLISFMNIDSSKNLFLIIGVLSLIAVIVVLVMKRRNK